MQAKFLDMHADRDDNTTMHEPIFQSPLVQDTVRKRLTQSAGLPPERKPKTCTRHGLSCEVNLGLLVLYFSSLCFVRILTLQIAILCGVELTQ
eukprot:4894742-Amphidinium_carterae.1